MQRKVVLVKAAVEYSIDGYSALKKISVATRAEMLNGKLEAREGLRGYSLSLASTK